MEEKVPVMHWVWVAADRPVIAGATQGITVYSKAPIAGYVPLRAAPPSKSVVIPVSVTPTKLVADGR
jgi:hypothetical protein